MPVVGAPATTSSVILDPVSEDAANVELDISTGNYGLVSHAYPTPSVIAQWASSVSTEGALLGTKRHDNRQISITVDVDGLGALQDLEAKLAKLYREGGTIKRAYTDGREIIFDVLVMDGYEPTFDQTHHLADVTTVQFTLTCAPYGRQAEITLDDHAETTLPVLVITEADIPGDMPALGRLVIDNDVAQAQGALWWGIQSRYYDAASTAALFYQGEACAMVNATAAVGPTGASGSGSNVARSSALPTGSTSIIAIGASATAQTHVGTFRVFARVQAPATNAGTVSVGITWQTVVGGPLVTNAAVPLVDSSDFPVEGSWALLDLGMISLPKVNVGTQGWIGHVYASSTSLSDRVDIDWLLLLPVDEGSGESISYDPGDPDKVISASGSFTVRYDAALTSATAGYWAAPPIYQGDYLRVPPSGPEGRPLRVVVKLARGNDAATTLGSSGSVYRDPAIDALSARLYVQPRYLVVPES